MGREEVLLEDDEDAVSSPPSIHSPLMRESRHTPKGKKQQGSVHDETNTIEEHVFIRYRAIR